jgi:hypothetical protein
MGEEEIESKDNITRMFSDNKEILSSDEQLAIDIIKRFNIDLETMKTMPAFDKPLKQLFWEEQKK